MRKGFLAALALAVGNTSAFAQFEAAAQPNYSPVPNNGQVWVVAPTSARTAPPAPIYYNAPPAGYAPAQAPVYYNTPAPVPFNPQPYYPNVAPRQGYVMPGPGYLPQGYFPAPAIRPMPMQAPVVMREAPSTPVPPEPVRSPVAAQTPTSTGAAPSTTTTTTVISGPTYVTSVPAQGVSRSGVMPRPAAYFDTLPPQEPIEFHRKCNESLWVSGDYLLGWIRQGPLSTPLLTTGSVTDFDPGALNEPGTAVLFGNRDLDFRMFHGARLEVGSFFDQDNRFSADVSGFYMLPRHVRYSVASDANGLPILGRPVFNVVDGDEDVYQIAFPIIDPAAPVLITGSSKIDARAQIWGLEANGRWHSYCKRHLHTELFGGFRTVRLEEGITISDQLTTAFDNSGLSFNGFPVFGGESIADQDRFLTYNQFYGGQVGAKVRFEGTGFYVDVTGKVAVGVTDQRVRIEGSTTLISPFGNQTSPGGILAGVTNGGEHNRQVFGVIPEFGLNCGVDITSHIRLKAGYSCMMWSGVARPGDHIDHNVNPAFVPSDQDFAAVSGPARPAFSFREQVFFLQSLNFGLEFHF